MSNSVKIILIILIIVSVAAGVLAVAAFIGKEREYAKRVLLEDKLASTLKEKRDVEKELDTTKTAKAELETKFKEIEAKTEKITAQLEAEQEKARVALTDIDLKKKELEKLKVDLDNERKEKLVISKKLDQIQRDYESKDKENASLSKEKSTLEKKITELEQRFVNLDKIVVNPANTDAGSLQSSSAVQKMALEGNVLVVNRDYSFIVTDLGNDDGIQKGMVFFVKDNGNVLGKAEIDKVYDTMSSATILAGAKLNDIKKGNVVVQAQ